MKAFEEWLKENSEKTGYLYDDYAERERRKGFVGGMEHALQLYCEDVTNFHENILQELKELDN